MTLSGFSTAGHSVGRVGRISDVQRWGRIWASAEVARDLSDFPAFIFAGLLAGILEAIEEIC